MGCDGTHKNLLPPSFCRGMLQIHAFLSTHSSSRPIPPRRAILDAGLVDSGLVNDVSPRVSRRCVRPSHTGHVTVIQQDERRDDTSVW